MFCRNWVVKPLVISPKYRKKGLGRILYESSLNHFPEEDRKEIYYGGPEIKNLDLFVRKFVKEKEANLELSVGNSHWFYRAGHARYGDQKLGGIVWLDWDLEFKPIEGLNQIVGHTTSKTGKILKNNENL